MSSFLDKMTHLSRQRVEESSRQVPLEAIRNAALTSSAPRPLVGFGEPFDLIAELKPRSPAAGAFPARDPATTAAGYERGGAAIISVLTEPSSFGGSLDALRRAHGAVTAPIMAKDFVIDPYQVYEARASGADGVLLIARILPDDLLDSLVATAASLGMFTLLEAFDHGDLERVVALVDRAPQALIGVNCRDLDTLEVAPERHRELAGSLPAGRVAVAESGMHGPEDLERVAGLGYRAALVGSMLMRSDDPTSVVHAMVEAGRRAAAVTT